MIGKAISFPVMEVRLSPEQEERLAAIAGDTGRTTDELVRAAVALWERRQLHRPPGPKLSLAEAAAKLRDLREGNFLPAGDTLKDLIDYGRA